MGKLNLWVGRRALLKGKCLLRFWTSSLASFLPSKAVSWSSLRNRTHSAHWDLALLRDSVDKCLYKYKVLAVQAMADGQFLWPTRIKNHFVWHFADVVLYLNPRFEWTSWTYLNENFAQKQIRGHKHVLVGGTVSHKIGCKMMAKCGSIVGIAEEKVWKCLL